MFKIPWGYQRRSLHNIRSQSTVGHLELPVFRCLRPRRISRNGPNSVQVQGRTLKKRVVTMFKAKVRTLKKNYFHCSMPSLRFLGISMYHAELCTSEASIYTGVSMLMSQNISMSQTPYPMLHVPRSPDHS
jgi:hypothetical protein